MRFRGKEGVNGRSKMLIEAVMRNDGAAARRALASGADANLAPNGVPLLTIASIRGGIDVVRELLSNGADPNPIDHTGEHTLGYLAMLGTSEQQLSIIDELVERGADVEAVNGRSTSPIELAVVYLNRGAAARLYSHGARTQRKEAYAVCPTAGSRSH